jgi:valyl-tRNA synthetase
MNLPKRYNPKTSEPKLQEQWERLGVYRFRGDQGLVYSIDTPPATVSGHLHLGHVYSYSQPDFMARFWRMMGRDIFYPMGFDDNGLPTGRLVEKLTGQSAREMGRETFAARCEAIGAEYGAQYEALWRRLGLSVDWRQTYRTIEPRAQRISQHSFIELYEQGLVERRKAPSIWCPECGTAIAQAELEDLERNTTFYDLAFRLADGSTLPIATTRPELLPACVAIFVHPEDDRYRSIVGTRAVVPHFGQTVTILQDPNADPNKGTGAVMCCTFGDVTDVGWWFTHNLPLVEAIDAEGRLTTAAGAYSGLHVTEGRRQIVDTLASDGLLLGSTPTGQSVRVHERCDTPVEYIVRPQWFLRVLDFRRELLQAADRITWRPEHMKARYVQWVEHLGWDWCLSRQRAFGVPFPVWYCSACGATLAADKETLPIDPGTAAPPNACACGSGSFTPETDVMDTWATSSLTPQIAGHWLSDPALHDRVFPMSVRPQAHDIIRTWTFYTIVKSLHHHGVTPWREINISGWGIAGEGMGKISKSRGGGPASPMDMIERYSADALRYWAASTGLGKDAVISELKIEMGAKLINKLWNVARFGQRFLSDYRPGAKSPALSPSDRWILSRTQSLIERATAYMQSADYAAAKSEVEGFFWTELADNYLEMAKLRLYEEQHPGRDAARYTLYHVLLATLKLLALFVPHVTEHIYLELYAEDEGQVSIHVSQWPVADARLQDPTWEETGETLVAVATAVRRYKSERSLPLSTALQKLQLAVQDPKLRNALQDAVPDLASITRAQEITVCSDGLDPRVEVIESREGVVIGLVQ